MTDKFRHNHKHQQRKPIEPKTSFNKVQASLYDSFADAYGMEYMLQNVLQIAWPVYKVKLDVIVTAEPENVLKEIHFTLLQLIKLNINTYESIAAFLGLEPTDFLLDELLELRKNYLIEYHNEAFHIKTMGEDYLNGKINIPVTEKKVYSFCVDGFTNEIINDYLFPLADDTFQQIEEQSTKIDYAFIEKHWLTINAKYKANNKGFEIVDLANGRQSIDSHPLFEKRYLLIFKGKDGEEEGKLKLKLINDNRQEFSSACGVIETHVFKSPENYLQKFEGFEYRASGKNNNPLKDKLNAINGYMHINFQEVDDYLRYALANGKIVYLEVPRILRKAKSFIDDIEQFLKKPESKLYLIYGVSHDYKHDEDTLSKLNELKRSHRNFVLIDLPDHAFNIGLEVSGVHNRTIIKDNDFYIETSYNFFTLDVERKEKISAETATIFKRDVEDYFNKQKQLYHIMR